MATRKEIAEHLGLSIRTISNRIRAGIFPASKGARGIDLDACRLAELEYWRGRATGQVSGDLDAQVERARLLHFQANKAEMEAKQLAGSLIPIEQVADVVGEEYANVRAKLLAIPTKAAPQVVGLSTVATRAKLDEMVCEALDELVADTALAPPIGESSKL